jgi:threonine/homoserine/homoserine lactone efflux protein
MIGNLLAYLGVSALVIVTPGPDTALTIKNTLSGGRRSGIFTALGVSTGQAIWSVATSAGLAAVLLTVHPVFTAVQLAGGAYLVFLGAQAIRGTLSASIHGDGVAVSPARHAKEEIAGLRQGILSNLGNPKMAIFFTSLLPQFTSHAHREFFTFLGLGLIFCSLTLLWLSGYAVVVASVGAVLQRSAVRRALDAATGTILIGFGLRLAAERF